MNEMNPKRRGKPARSIEVSFAQDIPSALLIPVSDPNSANATMLFSARFVSAMQLFELSPADLGEHGEHVAIAAKIFARLFQGFGWEPPRADGRHSNSIRNSRHWPIYLQALRLRDEDSSLTPAAAWVRASEAMKVKEKENITDKGIRTRWARLKRNSAIVEFEKCAAAMGVKAIASTLEKIDRHG